MERLEEESRQDGWVFDKLLEFGWAIHFFELTEFPHGYLLAFLLIGNIRLVDFECLAVQHKKISPILVLFRKAICLFDAYQEPTLEV